MNKDSFLEHIKLLSPEQLNKLIEQKGKPRKRIKVIIFRDENGNIINK